jgi:hypothetical protein
MNKILFLLLVVSLPLAAAETGYRIVHPDGTVEFTDDPNRGGEKVEIEEVPTFHSVVPTTKSGSATNRSQSSAGKEDQAASYQSLTITAPKAEQTIWFDGGPIAVNVNVAPQLAEGDSVVVLLDGKEVTRGQRTSFNLPQVERGSHTIGAKVVNASGTTVLRASPVTFYMQRHTINR